MSKKKKYIYFSKIISSIENTRKKNNKNWMDLLRLGFKYNPDETKKILKEIFKEDRKITNLVKKMIK
tara:strand:+ start:712 stop:912 length:201 start_codon:yes stop_codon:yes gene_type:complete